MTIRLPQLSKTLSCDKGDNLFRTLREGGVPVASSCQGDGICGKCLVNVVAGSENLTLPTELEKRLQAKYKFSAPWRISCQCAVEGDIEVRTNYW